MREISAQTHPGKVREHNEDAVVVVPEQGICVVADGVGGHQRGEVASRLVCDTVRGGLLAGEQIQEVILQAHQQVLKAIDASSQGEQLQAGMGSTVVAVKILNDVKFELAWVGDSRAYLWDRTDGSLRQLSEDHSVVAQLLSQQVITPEQAKNHPDRNVITQSLGVSQDMQLDVGFFSGALRPEEELLLCSDGLTDELSDDDIALTLREHTGALAQQEALLDKVLQSPARDNVSVIVVGPALQDDGSVQTRLGGWLNVLAFFLVISAFVFAVAQLL